MVVVVVVVNDGGVVVIGGAVVVLGGEGVAGGGPSTYSRRGNASVLSAWFMCSSTSAPEPSRMWLNTQGKSHMPSWFL